jgi:hypothetical protein
MNKEHLGVYRAYLVLEEASQKQDDWNCFPVCSAHFFLSSLTILFITFINFRLGVVPSLAYTCTNLYTIYLQFVNSQCMLPCHHSAFSAPCFGFMVSRALIPCYRHLMQLGSIMEDSLYGLNVIFFLIHICALLRTL